MTGMDIGEFTINDAYLSSALIILIAITMVGGWNPPPPPGFLGLNSLVNYLKNLSNYFIDLSKCLNTN